MPGRLLWKLLAIHVLVIGLVILVVWLTIDSSAEAFSSAISDFNGSSVASCGAACR